MGYCSSCPVPLPDTRLSPLKSPRSPTAKKPLKTSHDLWKKVQHSQYDTGGFLLPGSFLAYFCRLESQFPPDTKCSAPLDNSWFLSSRTLFASGLPLHLLLLLRTYCPFPHLRNSNSPFSIQVTLIFNRLFPQFVGKINHFPYSTSSIFLFKSVSEKGFTFCVCLSHLMVWNKRQDK